MAGNLQQLILEIIARDRASSGLTTISKAAESASDHAGELNKKLEELGRKSARARVALEGDQKAQASLDRIDAKLLTLDRRTATGKISVEGAARALAEISAVDAELDNMGRKDGPAWSARDALSSLNVSGMVALGAGAVALSPVIATLGVGLGGLGLAAAGVAAPIEKAAHKAGGLSANLKLLDPEQRTVAQGILGLGKQYDQFQKILKPEILGAFSGGLTIASHLLRDIQPVTIATGKAFDVFLGRIDAEFQSGTWQQFFRWIAQQAGPDMQLLGNVFVDLAHDIPGFLEQLQPLAVALLKVTDGALKAFGALEKVHLVLPLFGAAVGALVAGPLGALIGGLAGLAIQEAVAGDAAKRTGLQDIPKLRTAIVSATTATVDWSLVASQARDRLYGTGGAAVVTSSKVADLTLHVKNLTTQVRQLSDAENKALSPLLAYTNALITQRDDADKLRASLKASHDQIGLNTAVQRASFSAANTYIQDLLNTSQAAVKSHQGIDAQISSIRQALPLLTHVKGGTRDYWKEVQALTGWLHRLEQVKTIAEEVKVYGSGQWAVQGGGHFTVGPGAARGAYITAGTTPTADDVLVRASKGELVVPAGMVNAGAVDHLRGQIPGFASGGIIPGYSGTLKGLQPWGQHNWTATIQAITAGIAGSMAKALAAPGASLSTSAGIRAEQMYALSLFPYFGWAASQLPSLIWLWNRESGWNPNARNPSSGAYGIPQALPASKMGILGGTWAGQILWGEEYIKGRYGSPASAAAHEAAVGWYDRGGYLPPGLSLAYNGTGKPERVGGGNTYNISVYVAPGADADTGRRIVAAIRAHEMRSGKSWRS